MVYSVCSSLMASPSVTIMVLNITTERGSPVENLNHKWSCLDGSGSECDGRTEVSTQLRP